MPLSSKGKDGKPSQGLGLSLGSEPRERHHLLETGFPVRAKCTILAAGGSIAGRALPERSPGQGQEVKGAKLALRHVGEWQR